MMMLTRVSQIGFQKTQQSRPFRGEDQLGLDAHNPMCRHRLPFQKYSHRSHHVFMMALAPKISSCRQHLRSYQSLAQPEESLEFSLFYFLPFLAWRCSAGEHEKEEKQKEQKKRDRRTFPKDHELANTPAVHVLCNMQQDATKLMLLGSERICRTCA